MKKIIVTEEQGKVLEKVLGLDRPKFVKLALVCERIALEGIHEGLSMVDVAKILEGEPYEVKREFKVGDIVGKYERKEMQIYHVVEKEDLAGDSITLEKLDKTYFLISKAENREDLK